MLNRFVLSLISASLVAQTTTSVPTKKKRVSPIDLKNSRLSPLISKSLMSEKPELNSPTD